MLDKVQYWVSQTLHAQVNPSPTVAHLEVNPWGDTCAFWSCCYLWCRNALQLGVCKYLWSSLILSQTTDPSRSVGLVWFAWFFPRCTWRASTCRACAEPLSCGPLPGAAFQWVSIVMELWIWRQNYTKNFWNCSRMRNVQAARLNRRHCSCPCCSLSPFFVCVCAPIPPPLRLPHINIICFVLRK